MRRLGLVLFCGLITVSAAACGAAADDPVRPTATLTPVPTADSTQISPSSERRPIIPDFPSVSPASGASGAASDALCTPTRPTAVGGALPALRVGKLGVAAVHTGTELSLIALDGPGQMVPLTSGSRNADYAGSTKTSTGMDVYFTSEECRTNAYGRRTITLYRVAVPGGIPQRLFSFEGTAKDDVGTIAAVSPDARRVAYSAASGLHVMDLSSGSDRLVVAAGIGCGTPGHGIADCFGQFSPWWIADGKAILYTHIGWEWSWPMVVAPDPPGQPVQVGSNGFGLGSALGSALCVGDTRSVVVLDIVAKTRVAIATSPADMPSPDGSIGTGCAWSTHGRLAVAFSEWQQVPRAGGVGTDLVATHIRILDSNRTELVDVRGDRDHQIGNVIGWTADGEQVLLRKYDPATSAELALMSLDGTTKPLAVPLASRDRIQAVLPWAP